MELIANGIYNQYEGFFVYIATEKNVELSELWTGYFIHTLNTRNGTHYRRTDTFQQS